MNVLVLNGSPKGKNSNTMLLTDAFIYGLNKFKNHNIKIVGLSQKNIERCLGCFLCWKKEPYHCLMHF